MLHQPSELSGGQQQRVAVARAIVTNPTLILADEPTGNLDSRSTEDVLRIFARLNDEGRTVVLITHEPDVAEQAKRVIQLADGRIVEDRRLVELDAASPAVHAQKSAHQLYGGRAHMIARETLRIAWGGITANKLRSGLTILGMTIGVASVIVLIAVGNGSSKAVQSRIQSLGTNVLIVQGSGGLRRFAGVQLHEQRLAHEGRRAGAAGPGPRARREERLTGRQREQRDARLRRHQLRTLVVRRHHPVLPDRPQLRARRRALLHHRRRHQAQPRGGDRPGSRPGTVRRRGARSGRR